MGRLTEEKVIGGNDIKAGGQLSKEKEARSALLSGNAMRYFMVTETDHLVKSTINSI
jgi:hypothetical protein